MCICCFFVLHINSPYISTHFKNNYKTRIKTFVGLKWDEVKMWLCCNKITFAKLSETPEIKKKKKKDRKKKEGRKEEKKPRRRFRDSRASQRNSTRQLHSVPWQQPRHWSPARFEMTNGRAGSGWCVLLGKHDAVGRHGYSGTSTEEEEAKGANYNYTAGRLCFSCTSFPPLLSFSFLKHTLHTPICLDFTQLKIMSQPRWLAFPGSTP